MCLALPGRVESIDETAALRTGEVSFAGIRRSVCLAFVPEAVVGSFVVVHAGFAISVLDEFEAERTLALLAAAARDDATRAR